MTFLIQEQCKGIDIEINTDNTLLFVRLFTLLYADDTIIMAEHVIDLQEHLNAFSSYCKRWKLSINYNTTKALVFGLRNTANISLTIASNSVEITDNFIL